MKNPEVSERPSAKSADNPGEKQLTPREQLAEENKALQAQNQVLSEMVEADRRLTKVFGGLMQPGTDRGTLQAEASALFQTLHGLDTLHRHDARAVASLYSPRFEGYLQRMDPAKLTALEASASAYLSSHPHTAGDKAVMETLLFCTQAELLWTRVDGVALHKIDTQELKAILEGANALWMDVEEHRAFLQPKKTDEPIPGTSFTVQELKTLLQDAAAVQDRRTVLRATKVIQNAAGQSNLSKMLPQERKALDEALDVYTKRPKQFSANVKQQVDKLIARLAKGSNAVAPLAPRAPAVSLGNAKAGF